MQSQNKAIVKRNNNKKFGKTVNEKIALPLQKTKII